MIYLKEPMLYRITRPVITILFNILFRPTYIGTSNIPKEGSFVLAGNHTSNLDCLLLISSTKKTIHFLAKEELVKGPKKIVFKNMGIIPVNRKIHDKDALKSAIYTLEQKRVIGIFPEGTINKTNKAILPFKIGAVKMAHDTNSLLVPFTITGTYKLFRKGITLEFYQPYFIKDDLSIENEQLMDWISKELIRKGDKF